MPARGMGMESSTGITGAPHSWARRARWPPAVTTTTRAPSPKAWLAAATVSSVLPENDTANTNVSGPTKPGHS